MWAEAHHGLAQEGTAFKEWAELWARRGYVALAMDLAGQGPDRKRLPDGGPAQDDGTKVADVPVMEAWIPAPELCRPASADCGRVASELG